MTDLEYRVRVKRFGSQLDPVRDKFYGMKTVDKAVKMLREWEADRDGRTKDTLDGTAELTIESRPVGEWTRHHI